MDMIELAQIGQRMRCLQKEYFRTRTSSALETAKQTERIFDDAVRAILSAAGPAAPGLFDRQQEGNRP